MKMLTIVLGIVFILLLLSLLATTIMELVSSFLGLRGKNLEKALKNLLASSDADERILEAFRNNALYKQLSYQFGDKRKAPAYVSAKTFQSILFNILLGDETQDMNKLREKIDALENEDLKNVLRQLLNESQSNLTDFKNRVQDWYDDVMDRATAWYRNNTKRLLVGIGFSLAVIFNADTIAIYQRLSANPDELEKVIVLAEAFAEKNDSLETYEIDTLLRNRLKSVELLKKQLEAVENPLGLGWESQKVLNEMTIGNWLIKLFGWIVTALAISLGAPFWFDLLKKLVSIRQTVAKTVQKE